MQILCHLEAFAVIWSIKRREIMFGYPTTVYTKHITVTQLFQGKNFTGCLDRWYITLQELKPVIKCLPGKANVVADMLS